MDMPWSSDPLAWFDELRENRPAGWDARTRSWYVTRYEDVSGLLVDARLGARRVEYCPPGLTERQRDTYWLLMGFVDRWPVFSDPPRHTALRQLLRRLFAPEATRRVTDAVAATVGARCRRVPPDRLFAEAVRPGLAQALAALLDEEPEDLPQLTEWSSKILAVGSIESYRPEIGEAARQALEEFSRFVEDRCDAGKGHLARALRPALQAGELDLLDATATYAQLVTGALEPSASATAVLLRELTSGPLARKEFTADPGAAITEALRLATPFHLAPRRALTDIPLHGEVVEEGSRVVLVLAAANRDPRSFPDPLSFRPGRPARPHLAFGRGRHACLGAGATRHAMAAVVVQLLEAGALDGLPPLRPVWETDFGARFARDVRPASA
ncbi:cytochrome P450 [Streptomyces sp. B4I13]|nr:cytochrome P450 [Streptomyces sp. B4I13]